jgi:hypothetical protein
MRLNGWQRIWIVVPIIWATALLASEPQSICGSVKRVDENVVTRPGFCWWLRQKQLVVSADLFENSLHQPMLVRHTFRWLLENFVVASALVMASGISRAKNIRASLFIVLPPRPGEARALSVFCHRGLTPPRRNEKCRNDSIEETYYYSRF